LVLGQFMILGAVGLKEQGGGLGIDRNTGMERCDDAASVIELSGIVKWFDAFKGYGFIIPDNGMPDIFLHVTCLKRKGFRIAYEGAHVVAEVLQRRRGLLALRILSMDESTATRGTQRPRPRTHDSVMATSGFEQAQVKWFNRPHGFGFLTRGQGSPDIFVHANVLRRCGLAGLQRGQNVLVRFGPGANGLAATEVRTERTPLDPAAH